MATTQVVNAQSVNTKLILLVFAAMTLAFGFVAIITNMIVDSKVNALTAQLAAYQQNPVTVTPGAQSNSIGACVSPNEEAAQAGNTSSQNNGSGYTKYLAPISQSNSSTTNVTSNNSYVIRDSGNTTNTDNSVTIQDNNVNSGNTDNSVTISDNIVISDSGNTTNTDNSVDNSVTISDNTVVIDNSITDNSINDSLNDNTVVVVAP